MNMRTFSIWPALALLLGTTSGTAAQTEDEPVSLLALVEHPVREGDSAQATPATYADGAFPPQVAATVERVIPFSLRAVGPEGAPAQAAGAAVDIRLPALDVERLRQEDQARSQEQRAT